MTYLQMVLTIMASVLASSGFWAYLQFKMSYKDSKTKLLMGLAHDRIVTMSMAYIDRGSITHEEYENLNKYLFKPYETIGADETAKRLMCEVKKLPIRGGVNYE